MPKHSPYLTVREAADFLGVSITRIGQLIKAGKLAAKPIRIGYRDVAHLSRKAVEARAAEKGQ